MADIAIFRINYKSDFILTLNSDAGWMTPFCIKFWTGAPSQAYFVGFDGTTYTHCAPVSGDPTKLLVQFDDHHLPIGDLQFQIAYHFTVADFPTSVEDEVINQSSVIIEVDDAPAQVMLDLNGETAPEIEFSLPAYANEAQRIANEEQRIAHEAIRIVNEESRIAAETVRQQNEEQRISQETARVNEFAELKQESETATDDANVAAALANEKAALAADKAALADDAATLANAKAQLAADKAALADAAATLANDKATLAQQKAEYAQTQGDYAKSQGNYAKQQGEIAEEDHERAEADHTRAESDHATAGTDHTQAGTDHTRAESDHATAAADHTQAGQDHTRAESDHTQATSDHTQAGTDHTRAESDHATASADHTQAGTDHTRAESDHTRAESDHAAVELYVDSLGAFDISAYHATGGVLAKYADLTAALGTNGANIPEAIRKGGMSVKFVQSSDNKYVRYNLLADSFTTDTAQWAVDDGGVYVENPEFVYIKADAEGKILWAIKIDGDIYYGAGVPQQVVDYINEKIAELSLNEYEDIVAFLNGLEEGDKTLQTLLNEKVDKEEGKSLINSEYASTKSSIDSPEFLEVTKDSEGKIVSYRDKDGILHENVGIETEVISLNERLILSANAKQQLKGDLEDVEPTDIVSLNDAVYTGNALRNLKRPSRSDDTEVYTPFVLLHASDIHGDEDNLNRIVEYKQYWNSYIDDTIISGDIVSSVFDDGIAFYENNVEAHDIMLAIGNHDTTSYIDGHAILNAHAGQDSYEQYIKDFYAEWGNVSVVTNKCYYHKDYASYGIRLIVTDCMEGASADQLTWFEGVLASTPLGYSIICVSHYPYCPKITDTQNASPHIECSFDSRQDAPVAASTRIPDSFIAAVESWLAADNNANAGRFICWLTGHAHTDYVCLAKNTNQLVLTIDTAAHTARNIGYSDTERVENKKSMDLFNLLGIDTYQKLIKVVRVGADMDSWMRSKKTMCIQYASNSTYILENNVPKLIYCN